MGTKKGQVRKTARRAYEEWAYGTGKAPKSPKDLIRMMKKKGQMTPIQYMKIQKRRY